MASASGAGGIGEGKKVIVVGAGLAGALMACYLARLGYTVEVYERRNDPRKKGYVGGRSINLALSARGLAGLRGAGLEDVVMKNDAIPMQGRMIHPVHGELMYQPYSVNASDAINSVSRGGLNITLLNAAEAFPNVKLFFDHFCLDVDFNTPSASFQSEQHGLVHVKGDLIIGADGVFSAVRLAMQKTDRFNYSQTYLESGYKELRIPPAAEVGVDPARYNGFAMEPHALHIWPRGGSMMIALPNRDKSFTCTLFWPHTGKHSFANLRTPSDIRSFFQTHYPDAVPLMPTLVEDFQRNPTSSLCTVRCWPWHVNHKAVLLGDAAHAVVPFYGQGMNASFEDCLALAQALERYGSDFARALDAYQLERKANCDAISDMALENFVEMRDHTAHRLFHYKKRLEHALHRHFPTLMTPQYNLVSFSTVPYAVARQRGRRVDLVVRSIFGLALALGAVVVLRAVLRLPWNLSTVLAVVAAWQGVMRLLPRATTSQVLPRARL